MRFVAVLAGLVLLGSLPSHATVTLEVYFENGEISQGSLAVIVADVAGNGFHPLTEVDVSGTEILVGSSIGDSDDQIIALFPAASTGEWNGGAGFASTFPSLDYSALGISEGTPLVIYVFPTLSTADSNFILGDEFVAYRNTNAGGSGGDSPFLAPPDPGVYTISTLTAAFGGDFDPAAPATGESYSEGASGYTGSGNPDDFGNSRRNATDLTGATVPGGLDPGDLDFFRFTLTELSAFSAGALGTGDIEVWIFAEDGTLISGPDETGDPDFRGVLDPGSYFLAVRNGSEFEAASYSLTNSSRQAVSGRADITVGKSAGSQKGGDFYSSSGAGQAYLAKSKRGRKVRAFFTVGNDGDIASSLGVRGTRGNRFYKLKYIRLTGGSGNVTASVSRGGFLTNYEPSQSFLYRLDLKPTKAGKERSKRGNFSIDAAGPSGVDRGKVGVKIINK